ncbi:MAG: right-handed parallel beta-helix repeat-containing protein [Anaerolineales bacterium]
MAYPGQKPVLDGQGQVDRLLIFGQGVSYVRISRFALHDFTGWGIELSGDNHHILLDHLDVSGGEASVRFTYGEREEPPRQGPVEDVIVEDSVFQGCQFTVLDCTPGPCNRFTLRRLEIYHAGLGGADSYGADGIAIARGRDIVIEDSYVHDNSGDGIDLNSRDRQGNVLGIMIAHNRVVRNHLNGIKLWAGGRIENTRYGGRATARCGLAPGTAPSKSSTTPSPTICGISPSVDATGS